MTQPTSPTSPHPWQPATLWTGVLCSILAMAVCGILAGKIMLGQLSDPANDPRLESLRTALAAQPKDAALKDQIRLVDQELRQRYFTRQAFITRGQWLMGGFLGAALASFAAAGYLSRPRPMPGKSPDLNKLQRRAAALGRLSVASIAVAMALSAGTLVWLSHVSQANAGGGSGASAAVDTPLPDAKEYAANWPRFRGPEGSGIAAGGEYPEKWDGASGENIAWKTPIPLDGKNSPIVWGKRVFLSGADEKRREVYCYDADSGQLLWQRGVDPPRPSAKAPEVTTDTGYAAPTLATDGVRVYAIFANGDLAAFDFEGKQIWAKNIGPLDVEYGYASSLLTLGKKLIVLADQKGDLKQSAIIALDGFTGRQVWRTPRGALESWTTPIFIRGAGRDQIITAATPHVVAYDPDAGRELWRADCVAKDAVPSPVFTGSMVMAVNVGGSLAAIKPDGEGDVTATHVAWKFEDNLPDICSPLTDGTYIFMTTSGGKLTCVDAITGAKLWEQQLEDDSFQASPSMVGDKLYLLAESGNMVIVAADKEYRLLGKSPLGEKTHACPAFANGRIFIRGQKNLYAIGKR